MVLIGKIGTKKIELDRKLLAQFVQSHPEIFKKIAEKVNNIFF